MKLLSIAGKNRIALVLAVSISASASAQEGRYFIPSVTIAEVYDDNLFFTIDNESDDLITRVSPALEMGFASETSEWNGRYSFDAERYKEFSYLDSNLIRRFADLSMRVMSSSKLTLAADAHYTKTNTPADLSLAGNNFIPGLLAGRIVAERLSIHPELEYLFTPQTMGSLGYTLTNDKLFGSVDGDTHLLESALEHELSNKNSTLFGYNYRRYQFDQEDALNPLLTNRITQDTHTPWVGLQHNFSTLTSFTGRIGPRISDSSTDTYLLMSLDHEYSNGELIVSYEINDTTLLGEVGRLEAETFSIAFTYRGGENFEFQAVPGYAKVSRDEYAVDIYSAGLNASYKINEALYFTASYVLNYQNVDFINGSMAKVDRNVILLGLTLTYPRRSTRQSR